MSTPVGSVRDLGTWWPARRRFALLALLGGALTAATVARAGGPSWQGDLGLLYVGVVALALLLPPLITVQVLMGQLLLATVLPWWSGTGALLLAAASLAGVVVTAELLAAVARLDTAVERRPEGDLRRAGVAAVMGGAAYALVALVAAVPGPSGLVAVLLAAAACAALGGALGRV